MKNHKKLATAISGANRLLTGSVVAAALVFGALRVVRSDYYRSNRW